MVASLEKGCRLLYAIFF
ncbi:hypothetical protein PENFLA_c088G06200 [Penicillium flavigenum]|uniref:Uncharacterized protein n=1 Tax=Penicillium flavigenum TaxID=254877 RepID=A0A1V6S958_9EURO|nr:hypothetical protein PENFLA_c088G06200 [Penicillium flavigenum]